MGKKGILSYFVAKIGLLPLFGLIDSRRSALKILAYHRVMDVKDDYPFDIDLIDASTSLFENQVKYLSQNYEILTLSDAFKKFEQGGARKVVVLTFDDGFDDLYKNVFPVLKKYNVKATMFITSGLIGSNRTLWSELVVYAIKTNVGRSFSLNNVCAGDELEISNASKQKIIAELLKLMKSVQNEERIAIMSSLFQQLEFDAEAFSHDQSRMLSWKMIREMSDWGIEIGSHSESHSVLSSMPIDAVRDELVNSKREIELESGQSCSVFAYPVGGPNAYNAKVRQTVKDSKYEIACSYSPGVNYPESYNAFSLKRIHVDRSINFEWFKAQITCPSIFAAQFDEE